MESQDSNTEKIESLKERIVELEEDLEFYKSILEMKNSCIYNLYIKTIDGERVWVDRVLHQREDFLKLDKDPQVEEWLKPIKCER
tara:strand:- start:144 stop:398 length:255 start_codon:yes stop_codon:yes gene_type:complete